MELRESAQALCPGGGQRGLPLFAHCGVGSLLSFGRQGSTVGRSGAWLEALCPSTRARVPGRETLSGARTPPVPQRRIPEHPLVSRSRLEPRSGAKTHIRRISCGAKWSFYGSLTKRSTRGRAERS
jgi:hypothetical protein